jgi:serine/threonine-protein kinase RsbW
MAYCETSLMVGTSGPSRFERSLPLDVSALPGARQQLRAFLYDLDLENTVVEAILLCVQEACKNAVRFSGRSKGIHLSVTIEDGAVHAVVRDYGGGFDHSLMTHEAPDPLRDSGRGLFLIHALMDRVEIHRSAGTEVRMCKELA